MNSFKQKLTKSKIDCNTDSIQKQKCPKTKKRKFELVAANGQGQGSQSLNVLNKQMDKKAGCLSKKSTTPCVMLQEDLNAVKASKKKTSIQSKPEKDQKKIRARLVKHTHSVTQKRLSADDAENPGTHANNKSLKKTKRPRSTESSKQKLTQPDKKKFERKRRGCDAANGETSAEETRAETEQESYETRKQLISLCLKTLSYKEQNSFMCDNCVGVVEMLRQQESGVYDRVVYMCRPIDKRYNTAWVSLLGEKLKGIIVDTKETAQRCIRLLREKQMAPETFFPIDSLSIQPLNEAFRSITDPPNVKLLFDVVEFKSSAIEGVVLFLCNNVLVCNTVKDAMKVAYEFALEPRDVLSLDGTFCCKSGTVEFSGKKLQCMVENFNATRLQMEKIRAASELRELLSKQSKRQFELDQVKRKKAVCKRRRKKRKTSFEPPKNTVVSSHEKQKRVLEWVKNTNQLLCGTTVHAESETSRTSVV